MFGVEASLARETLQNMWLEQLYVCFLQSMATSTSEKTENTGEGFEKANHCLWISIAVMNITTKINFRKEGFISSDSYSPSSRNIRAGNQGRNPGAGTNAEAIKEWCLLACSLWFILLAILQHPRPPVQGRYYPQLVEPIHINHQPRKCTMGLSTGQSAGNIFFNFKQITSSKTIFILCKVHKTSQITHKI